MPWLNFTAQGITNLKFRLTWGSSAPPAVSLTSMGAETHPALQGLAVSDMALNKVWKLGQKLHIVKV
jgi:hypothetical protein